MSQDLCNVFNSASALFSCDIWPLFRKHATQKEQETVGRVFVICLVMASIMWIPVIQEMQGGQLFIYIQAVAAMFAPPICAVYVCAVLWKRTNETGAFWSLMIGFGLGVLRMAMSFMYKEPSCGQHVDERPWMLKHVHYMYYAAFLFWATITCTVLISYYTKPPAPFRLIRTTYWTRFDTNIRKDDKNVFEMKYSGATTRNSQQPTAQVTANNITSEGAAPPQLAPRASEDMSTSGSDAFLSSRSSQQRLFTIEEQQEKKTADLSSVMVDINKAAQASTAGTPQTAPVGGPPPRRALQHQASLTASATAAVRGAKDMVMAAATHFTGAPNSRIKFKNLDGEDDDEDDDDDDDDAGTTNAAESTMEDEDEDSDTARRQRQKRNRRSQSVLSAALSSYKQKQRGGYQKALNEDDEEDEDDDDDEKVNLNKSASFKNKRSDKSPTHEVSSSADDAHSGKTSTSKRPGRRSQKRTSGKLAKYEEDDDTESGRIYRCLDNSVSLLIKTRFEETILRIAVGAIILVAIGIFVLFSLPPAPPPKEVVDILIKN